MIIGAFKERKTNNDQPKKPQVDPNDPSVNPPVNPDDPVKPVNPDPSTNKFHIDVNKLQEIFETENSIQT